MPQLDLSELLLSVISVEELDYRANTENVRKQGEKLKGWSGHKDGFRKVLVRKTAPEGKYSVYCARTGGKARTDNQIPKVL